MKDRFSDEEWHLLKFLPFQAFMLVAAADGVVDESEMGILSAQLREAATLIDPLHRALFVDLVQEDLQEYVQGSTPDRFAESLDPMKALLRDRLSEEEYQSFVASLFASGLEVARASGGRFLGVGDKVSREEMDMLATFAAAFGLEPQALERYRD